MAHFSFNLVRHPPILFVPFCSTNNLFSYLVYHIGRTVLTGSNVSVVKLPTSDELYETGNKEH